MAPAPQREFGHATVTISTPVGVVDGCAVLLPTGYGARCNAWASDGRVFALGGHTATTAEGEVERIGADALAWSALKAGKVREAQAAINEALRLGTQDAKLLYHAGMIAHAAGERDVARRHLERALKISPRFDPLQAEAARKLLEK